MQRHSFHRDGLRFSYLDAGGEGQPLITLHAHIMEAATFASLAAALAPEWRVIALDQRGHGYSDHAPSYTRDNYIRDLEAFYTHLGLTNAVILGNSLGGVNAYQFAAHHPKKVRGLIIEDIGVVLSDNLNWVLDWAGEFPTREALAERIGPRLAPYLQDSFRETSTGWKLAFDPEDMVESGKCISGDHWQDWLATDCPALLLRGRNSPVTTQTEAEQMASRRLNTHLETLEGGHILHTENPAAFTAAVKTFLQPL